jgi:hypothetical protein
MSYLFEYLKYWICTNLIHINNSMKFVRFLYEPMKIEFHMKFLQTYGAW